MGTGLITSTSDIPNCSVKCVCDLEEERASTLAEKLGCDAVTDAADLLARDDIDAVIIAVFNNVHRPMAEAAAAAGKHVFSEKPLALSTVDAQAMIDAADNAGVKLMVGQVLRYLPPWHYIKTLIDSGKLGKPIGMQTTRIGGGWGADYRAGWRLKRESCGGPLFEINAHEIDFMRQVMGEAKRVTAHANNFVVAEIDYEDLVMLLIEFEDGGFGQLLAGHCARIGSYDSKIFLTEGTIYTGPAPLGLRYKVGDGEEITVEASELEAEPGVKREVREFVECVLNDTEPTIPGIEGLRNVEIAQAALISADERRSVDLPL